MDTNRVPLADLAFPAVTICNANLVKRSIAEQIDSKSRQYKMIQDFCKSEYEPIGTKETWESMFNVITNVGVQRTKYVFNANHKFPRIFRSIK